MWGQDCIVQTAQVLQRIIPTRVGTSFYSMSPNMQLRDHPHACGDKRLSLRLSPAPAGSSPRVWGQGYRKAITMQYRRIIPTRVGTRRISPPIAKYPRDHPHACGDKHIFWRLSYFAVGSSPRVWGQVSGSIFATSGTRIIPTRVGTSIYHGKAWKVEEDHPHACGDKS